MSKQIQDFLQFVKGIYSNLPAHLPKIFEPRQQRRVKDMSEIKTEQWLQDIYTVTPVITDKKNAENQSVTVSQENTNRDNNSNGKSAEKCANEQ